MYFGREIRLFRLYVTVPSVLVLPTALVVSVANRSEATGRFVLRQAPVGRNGRLSAVLESRTSPITRQDVQWSEVTNLEITRAGRLRRRSNPDKLPQMLNALSGPKSLVGTRPALPPQTELTALRKACEVLQYAPGIPGQTQVERYDGMPATEGADLDSLYSREQSRLIDLQVMLRTLVYVFHSPPRHR